MEELRVEELKKDLDIALKMLGSIVLSGDAVDMMAAAKVRIRKVAESLGGKKDG